MEQADLLCLVDFTLGDEQSASPSTIPFDGLVGQVSYNSTTKDLMVESNTGSVFEGKDANPR
jgi:hypothetical protein